MVSLTLGDTRGFRPTDQPERLPDRLDRRVRGARGRLRGKASIIPGLVNNRIRTVDGRRTNTDIYFLNAIRLADELGLARTRARRQAGPGGGQPQPGLGPQRPGGAAVGLSRRHARPGQPVAAVAAGRWRRRWSARVMPAGAACRASWARSNDRLHWGTELTEKTVEAVVPAPGQGGRRAGRRPGSASSPCAGRWTSGTSTTARVPPDASLMQTAALRSCTEGSTPSRASTRGSSSRCSTMARRAGVDAYFYVPAIAPEVYADPDGARYINQLRDQLAEVTKGHTNEQGALRHPGAPGPGPADEVQGHRAQARPGTRGRRAHRRPLPTCSRTPATAPDARDHERHHQARA